MPNPIIISNTCTGQNLWRCKYKTAYNNPFISTVFPNDLDFVKLCNNIQHYVNCKPLLGEPRSDTIFAKQNNGKWWNYHSIKVPYPVIYLDDIEIHCIHEQNPYKCIATFERRFERMRELVQQGVQVFGVLSYSEIMNDHDDLQKVIDTFLSNPNNIFAGPSMYNTIPKSNYIVHTPFDDVKLDRNESRVYLFNNQDINSALFIKYLDSLKFTF